MKKINSKTVVGKALNNFGEKFAIGYFIGNYFNI